MVRMGSKMTGPLPAVMSKGMFMPAMGVRMSEKRITPSGWNARQGCRLTSTWAGRGGAGGRGGRAQVGGWAGAGWRILGNGGTANAWQLMLLRWAEWARARARAPISRPAAQLRRSPRAAPLFLPQGCIDPQSVPASQTRARPLIHPTTTPLATTTPADVPQARSLPTHSSASRAGAPPWHQRAAATRRRKAACCSTRGRRPPPATHPPPPSAPPCSVNPTHPPTAMSTFSERSRKVVCFLQSSWYTFMYRPA